MQILNRIFLTVCVLVALSLTSFAEKINVQETTLDNGLRIIVIKTNVKDIVCGGVGYFVGSGDDPRNVVGISHFLEHMMFRGTKHLSMEKVRELAYDYNENWGSRAFTSFDVTFFGHTSNKAFLDSNLKVDAERMRNLLFRESDIEKERKIIIEERKRRVESNPITHYMEEAAWKATYLYSSYSYPLSGYLDQIMACDKEALQKHYDRYYVPNNAFVLLVGDITLEEAVEKVSKYFGGIPKGKDPKRSRIIDPKDTGLKFTIDRESKSIAVHNLNVIYRVDRDLIGDVKKLSIAEFALEILARGESSVLYQTLVDKEKLSYVVDSYLDVRAFDNARINIATVFRENQSKKNVYKKITAIAESYADKYLTKELFEKEKKKQLDQIEMLKDDPYSMTMFVLTYLINGYRLDEVDNIENIIRGVKFEEVVETARKIFNKKNRIMRIYSHPELG
ncbi:MAG: insulinase family protein [Holosporales bacterium]|nr:insulinase family protein [Holosporales bacterium]